MKLKFILFFLIFMAVNAVLNAQSVTITETTLPTTCSRDTLKIPVVLSGSWDKTNFFVLKLKSNFAQVDTTIYVISLNSTSPLLFKLPEFFATEKIQYNFSFLATVESTNPKVVSNSSYFNMKMLSVIELGTPVEIINSNVRIPSYYVMKNSVANIPVKIFRGTMDTFEKGMWSDSTFVLFQDNVINLLPKKTTKYKLESISNSCGLGKVIPPSEFILKVNTFNIKIVDVYPKKICDTKNIQIEIDYDRGIIDPDKFYVEMYDDNKKAFKSYKLKSIDLKRFAFDIDTVYTFGKYYLRVRCDNPDVASNFTEINIVEPPRIELDYFSYEMKNYTIDYKALLNIYLKNTTSNSDNPTYSVKFTNGLELVNFTNDFYGSTSGIEIKPTENQYYKIESVITQTCGFTKNFTVTGEKEIKVKNDFIIKDVLNKKYCGNEKVKFRIQTDKTFNFDNFFTVELEIMGSNIKNIDIPVKQNEDGSLEFILPNDSIFRPTIKFFSFYVKSSSPEMRSALYDEQLKVTTRPLIRSIPQNNIIETPSFYTNTVIEFEGSTKGKLSFSDGDTTFSVLFDESSEFRTIFLPIFALKTKTYTIQSIENSCGVLVPTPKLEFTIEVKKITKTIQVTDFPRQVCTKKRYDVSFVTTGSFVKNEEIIAKLTYYSIKDNKDITVEVGKGFTSPISIQISDSIPRGRTSLVLLSSVPNNQNSSIESTVSNLFIINGQEIERNNYFISSNIHELPINKSVDILKGDELKSVFISSNSPYQTFGLKVNDTWYENLSETASTNSKIEISFKPKTDTLYILKGLKNACGVQEINDTLRVFVKKYRIRPVLNSEIFRCQGNLLSIAFLIDGKGVKIDNYKIYFKPSSIGFSGSIPESLKYEAKIMNKSLQGCTVVIPEMPYENQVSVHFEAADNSSDYASVVNPPYGYFGKKYIVKLTSKDEKDTVWVSEQMNTVPFYISTLNSFNPQWTGNINSENSSDNSFYETLLNAYQQSMIQESYVGTDLKYIIKNIESTCGYGISLGSVLVKRCYDNPYLSNVPNSRISQDWYSKNTIKSEVKVDKSNTLYSAAQSIELLPGFMADGGNRFKAEIKGCKLDVK